MVAWVDNGEVKLGKPMGITPSGLLKVDELRKLFWREYERENGENDGAWATTTMTKKAFDAGQDQRLDQDWVWVWDGMLANYSERELVLSETWPVVVDRWERRRQSAPKFDDDEVNLLKR